MLLDSLEDPRLASYRNIKDRELARLDGRFIAESDLVVRRLLASEYVVESVLVASRKAAAIALVVPPSVPLYELPEEKLDAIVGYPFHTGVLAIGYRKASSSINAIIEKCGVRSIVVVCPDLTNHENLGSIIRISSAFGADAIILGPRCCDPYYRLCIRVSMGTLFGLPVVRSQNLSADLSTLKREGNFKLIATVLDKGAEPLDRFQASPRIGILFGNEASGLLSDHTALCDSRVTLPMRRGTDSLNVAVAAGIFLYHFTRE